MEHLATNYWLLNLKQVRLALRISHSPVLICLIVFLKYPQSEFHLSADLQPLLAQS